MKRAGLKNNFDFETAGYAVGIAFLAELLFQLIVTCLGLSEMTTTWICVVGNQIVFCCTVIVLCNRKKVDFIEVTGLKRPPKWYVFPLSILVSMLCIIAFAPLAGCFREILQLLGYKYMPQYYIPMGNKGLFALSCMALGLGPVIGEEVLLRGATLGGLKKRSAIFGILVSALLFACLHGNLIQIVHQFLLGIVMAYLCICYDSIYPSAVVHCCNNVFALVIDYVYAKENLNARIYSYLCGDVTAFGTVGTIVLVAVCLLAFILLASLLFLMGYLAYKDDKEKKAGSIDEEGLRLFGIGNEEENGNIARKIFAFIKGKGGVSLEGEKNGMTGLWISFALLVVAIGANVVEAFL